MSENVRNELDDLLHAMGLAPDVPGFTRLAHDLSRLAQKDKPWGHRYVTSVYNGTLAPSKAFVRAVDMLGPYLDGQDPDAWGLPVTVFTLDPGSLSGAFVMEGAKVCPLCGMRFVGNVPHRKYCPKCSPPRQKTSETVDKD